MEHKTDNIYIYLWEEFNTIYVGRTINPKSRHYQHRHIPTEKTYQFSSEHGVEHPKMIIIENDLSIDEGVEREKYWIEHYRNETNYNVLNKSCGGQYGREKIYTDDEIKQHQKKYYQENKEKIKETKRKYRKKNKEELLIKQKQYRKEHREEILIQRKKHREENREKILEYKRNYREKHKEELRLKAKKYWEEHREEKKEYDKKYREKIKNS